MSATYYGPTTTTCYNDCRQEGCPGHTVRLVSKHGGIWVEENIKGEWQKVCDFGDLGWFGAACRMRSAS